MSESNLSSTDTEEDSATKVKEFKAFMFIILFFFPILLTVVFGAYGFIVWMLQATLGPPGHG
ncbi:periplasmic nitrate reductase, NapE protein [Thalassotalea maritima]|uniref:periplasmic nitrate reductase, NapE protein n=1 Tax=Thalassotalea maritima TaxID=3242416 RepID=UPI003526FC38